MPDWASIGICWALTTVTTLIILAIWSGVGRLRRRTRRRALRKESRTLSEKNTELESVQSQPLLELRCPQMTTQRSNGVASPNSSTSSNPPNDRRRQDDVTRWCSEHGLPETLVYTLRQQGFETKSALDGLRSEDLQGRDGNPALLLLPNKAAMVQLRDVLRKIHRQDSSNRTSGRSNLSGNSSARNPMPNWRSGGSDRTNDLTPTSNSDVFLRNFDEVDGPSSQDDNSRRNPRPTLPSKSPKQSANEQRFHGMISDEGLWDLTNLIGHEWRQLATHLNVSAKTQERIRETNSHNVSSAIHEMLVTWRDNCSANKEQMKGQLYTALLKVDRKDIANKLMKEGVDGSFEKLNQKVTSII